MKALQELLLALINVGSESSVSRSDFVLHFIKVQCRELNPVKDGTPQDVKEHLKYPEIFS